MAAASTIGWRWGCSVRKPWSAWKIGPPFADRTRSAAAAPRCSVPTKVMTALRGSTSPAGRPVHVPGPCRVLHHAGLEEQQGIVAAIVATWYSPAIGDAQRACCRSRRTHRRRTRSRSCRCSRWWRKARKPLMSQFPQRVQDADGGADRAHAHGDQARPRTAAGRRPEREQGDAVRAELDHSSTTTTRPVSGPPGTPRAARHAAGRARP